MIFEPIDLGWEVVDPVANVVDPSIAGRSERSVGYRLPHLDGRRTALGEGEDTLDLVVDAVLVA
jgi:hypothetical protein